MKHNCSPRTILNDSELAECEAKDAKKINDRLFRNILSSLRDILREYGEDSKSLARQARKHKAPIIRKNF